EVLRKRCPGATLTIHDAETVPELAPYLILPTPPSVGSGHLALVQLSWGCLLWARSSAKRRPCLATISRLRRFGIRSTPTKPISSSGTPRRPTTAPRPSPSP